MDMSDRHHLAQGHIPQPQSAPPCGEALQLDARALSSTALLQGHSVVRIEHNGAFYQLRNTRLGKLILTK